MTIHILSEETINKIAAGEVIERPANVVKELVENSIDAQSSIIEIEIKSAGRQLIRVRDNGIGMNRQDLSLAITRHATSKIKEFQDLNNLNTLGFRGEALPSIASVSHLLIQSQTKENSEGWEIKIIGGSIKESRAWAGSLGTIIEVRNLFFNTPARAKFLKSDNTERQHIIQIIEELALSNPGVSFKMVSDGKTVLNASSTENTKERLLDILGKDIVKDFTPLNVSHPNIKITGFVTKTENSLPTKNYQFLFINNRPVRFSKMMFHAVYEAYRETLPQGRHPGVIIFIQINPGEVDVNIHPTKREVRFSKEKEIHDLLLRSIKNTIIKPITVLLSEQYKLEEVDTQEQKSQAYIKEQSKDYSAFKKSSDTGYTPKYSASSSKQTDFVSVIDKEQQILSFGQLFSSYVLAQNQDELVIVDQHAACERIRYEKYISDWKNKQIPIQGLLLPITIELSSSKANLLNDNINILKEAGWEIEEFGTNTFRVIALPGILGTNIEVSDILEKIIEALYDQINLPSLEKVEKIIRSACRASIKAKESMSTQEMNQMLKDLFQCQVPYTCPHGRPTILKFSKSELEKHFGRK